MDAPLRSSSSHQPAIPFAPAQVIALGLVAASIGWAVWLLRDRPASEEVELLAGMTLPSSEMAIMEAAFDRAQLTDHRTDGGRVWVPRSRQSAYMRALVDAEALPREFGGSLRRALEKNSPWQSRALQDEMLRVAMQEELSLVICSMPGIERAAVLYDTETHGGLDAGGTNRPTKTASVNVRTQPDTELDPARVQAIRVLVSASIAGLNPERVAVTDLRSGRVHAGPLEPEEDREANADPALARQIAHERHLEAKVRRALAFIKGVAVDVSVVFGSPSDQAAPAPPPVRDALGPEAAQKLADANAPAEIRRPEATASPPTSAQPGEPSAPDSALDAVLVSIAVPESYFQAAFRMASERAGQPQLAPPALEAQEIERIRQHVLALLPVTRDPSRRRVVVTGFPVSAAVTGRREATPRPATERTTQRDDDGRSAQRFERVLADILAGRFDEVPRQAWLAATSVSVGLLAGLMWLLGGRTAGPTPGRSPRSPESPRIDWSARDDVRDDLPSASGVSRAASLLVCAALCHGLATAADPEPVAPLPEAVLQEARAGGNDARAHVVSPRSDTGRSQGVAPQVLPALPLPAPAAGAHGVAGDASSAVGRFGDWKLLATIVVAFMVLALASRMTRRRTAAPPPDVFEVLGEGSLGGQHAVRIVRFGPKTLLVGVSSNGCHTLAELADPQATACIAAACRGVTPPLRPLGTRPPHRPAVASAPLPAGGEAA